MSHQKWKWILLAGTVVAVLSGIALRWHNIAGSGFFFYDEGLYLNHNLMALDLIKANPPNTLTSGWQALLFYLKMALGSGKSLWFFVMDSRFFFSGVHDWNFAKYAAFGLGVLVLPLVYLLAYRLYRSRAVALLSMAIVALLPGSVFYARVALQESLSTVLVLLGFYVYLSSKNMGRHVIAAGVILAAAFFSNYRLLMLPVLMVAAEGWLSLSRREVFDIRKITWGCVSFAATVVLVGSALDAANMKVVFAWVFHQGDMAGSQFSWVNFLSYPYYLFCLETIAFGVFFFGSIVLFFKGERETMLPFILVVVQMLVFSFPSEKGARYIAVMLPFAGIMVAFLMYRLFYLAKGRGRWCVVACVVGMFFLMAGKSFQLSQAQSDHERAMQYLQKKESHLKVLSSQELVDVLYASDPKSVLPVPQRFERLMEAYSRGYRYLILDPQAYVSLVPEKKFTLQLKDYLSFIDARAVPVKVYPHMNQAFLERFVFEHSENLVQSIRFLADPDLKKLASLRIYDLSQSIPVMQVVAAQLKQKR